MKLDPLLNRRIIFKLHGMDPLDSTILKQDATGYWVRGGTLAPRLDQSNCSLPENDTPASLRDRILTTVNLPAIPNPMTTPTSLDHTLHAIADPTRRRILNALKQRGPASTNAPAIAKNGLCAGDIEERVHLSQPTISHHMSILTKAGLVDAAKQGQWRWYRRNEKALRRLVKSLRTQL
jgi:DNA-binding transcriptional ArsR family regulator